MSPAILYDSLTTTYDEVDVEYDAGEVVCGSYDTDDLYDADLVYDYDCATVPTTPSNEQNCLITIGRCGTQGVLLDGISSWDSSGRMVTVEGILHPSLLVSGYPTQAQLDAVLAERQRLLGLVNSPDEPIVPVIWAGDPTINGFYKILSVDVGFQGSSLQSGIFTVQIEMEQIIGYGAPQYETLLTGAALSNPNSASGKTWVGYPEGAVERWMQGAESQTRNVASRVSDSGVVTVETFPGIVNGIFTSFTTSDIYYNGSCGIYTEPELELRLGAQIPINEDSAKYWRIDNGLIRIEPSSVYYDDPVNAYGRDVGIFSLSFFNGISWSDPKDFNILHNQSGFAPTLVLAAFLNISVLRNSPETITIRCSMGQAISSSILQPSNYGRIYLDITLRRGARHASFFIKSDRGYRWTVRRVITEAATLKNGGIVATDADASGNKYILMTNTAFSYDLAAGTITNGEVGFTTYIQSWLFGIGYQFSAAAGQYEQAQGIINQFHSGQTEVMRIVSR